MQTTDIVIQFTEEFSTETDQSITTTTTQISPQEFSTEKDQTITTTAQNIPHNMNTVIKNIQTLLYDTEQALEKLEIKVYAITRFNSILILQLDRAYRKINSLLPPCDKQTPEMQKINELEEMERKKRYLEADVKDKSATEVMNTNLKSVSDLLRFMEDNMKDHQEKFNIYADE